MVKFNRELEYDIIPIAKTLLECEKNKANGSYNKAEVLEALNIVFSHKCYICENKNKITSYQIEHLKSHRGDSNLKFNWGNLFLSCAHCNNIKLQNYDDILDCTESEVDRLISFRISGKLGLCWCEVIEIMPIETTPKVLKTIELLENVYSGNTAGKKLESTNIRRELRAEVAKFTQYINDYYEAEGIDKEDSQILIVRELKASSPFAAFKRWIVKDNKEMLKDFLEYC